MGVQFGVVGLQPVGAFLGRAAVFTVLHTNKRRVRVRLRWGDLGRVRTYFRREGADATVDDCLGRARFRGWCCFRLCHPDI